MALTDEELKEIDGKFKEIIDAVDDLTKEDLKEKLVSLRAKLKREEKDVDEQNHHSGAPFTIKEAPKNMTNQPDKFVIKLGAGMRRQYAMQSPTTNIIVPKANFLQLAFFRNQSPKTSFHLIVNADPIMSQNETVATTRPA